MSTVMEKIVSRQEQLLELMTAWQKPVVSAVARTASMIDAGAERLPKMPSLPFTSELPTAQEMIEAQFGFAAKLIDANKRFALDLAGVVDGAAEATTEKKKPAAKASSSS
jgi:hypothetical protein